MTYPGDNFQAGFDATGLSPSLGTSLQLSDAFIEGDELDTEGDGGDHNPGGTPAPFTLIPTSTSNPRRPRTYAAGYSYPLRTLTVLFRDGVVYNYYNVEMPEWLSFRNAFSKGVWLKENLEIRGVGAGGEKVVGGQADALADTILTRARELRKNAAQREASPVKAPTPKLSGFQNAVLKKVREGLSSTEAITAARRDLNNLQMEIIGRRRRRR